MAKRAGLIMIVLAAATACAAVRADDAPHPREPYPSAAVLEAGTTTAAGIPVSPAQVQNPGPALFAGVDSTASALGGTAPPGGTLAELSSSHLPASHAVRVTAIPQAGREPPRLSTAGPAPADPWAMICALAVVGYIALRKLRIASAGG